MKSGPAHGPLTALIHVGSSGLASLRCDSPCLDISSSQPQHSLRWVHVFVSSPGWSSGEGLCEGREKEE